jgi:hypothetical protein
VVSVTSVEGGRREREVRKEGRKERKSVKNGKRSARNKESYGCSEQLHKSAERERDMSGRRL